MCFGGMAIVNKPKKINKYYSKYTNGLKEKLHTIKNMKSGNYHYWCVDKYNKIIDITPPQIEPMNDKPVYIEWKKEEQEEQTEYCKNYHIINNGEYGLMGFINTLNHTKNYKSGNCFENSYSLSYFNKDYRLVCGSFGFIDDETDKYNIISLDYGY